MSVPRSILVLIHTRGACGFAATAATFALDLWVFNTTGSYTAFALFAALASLTTFIVAPFAGVIVDRSDKRALLCLAEATTAAATLALAILSYASILTLPMVALGIVLISAATSLRWLALGPLLTMSLPSTDLSRANGLLQMYHGASIVFAPMLGLLALRSLSLASCMLVASLMHIISLSVLMSMWFRIPNQTQTKRREPILLAAADGFRWIAEHRPLFRLLIFFMSINVATSIFVASFSPYVLSAQSEDFLGLALACQGIGGVSAGAILGRVGLKAHTEGRVILLSSIAYGLLLVIWGLFRDQVIFVCVAFAFGALSTLIMVSSQTLWQSAVPSERQGKVFAVRMMTSYALAPLAVVGSIPLATEIAKPALSIFPQLQSLWGIGVAAELGLMLSVLGILILFSALTARYFGGFEVGKSDESSSDPTRGSNDHQLR